MWSGNEAVMWSGNEAIMRSGNEAILWSGNEAINCRQLSTLSNEIYVQDT